jgi:hypothetical protein
VDHAAQIELAREGGVLVGSRRAGAADDGELPDAAMQRWRHADSFTPAAGAATTPIMTA